MINIGAIVEGYGEVAAVPVLLRRLAERSEIAVRIMPPFRIPRGKLVQESELRRVVEAVARRVGPGGPILVLLDADDDCIANLATDLLNWCRLERPDREIAVVLAGHEFEAWFLAALDSLRGKRRVQRDATWVGDPDSVRHAKAQLSSRMDAPRYSPTVDQVALASIMDIDQARGRSRSFDKFCREVERLIGASG